MNRVQPPKTRAGAPATERLARKNRRGETLAFRAARMGLLKRIKPALTTELFRQETTDGNSIFRLLIADRRLIEAADLLTPAMLLEKDWFGGHPTIWLCNNNLTSKRNFPTIRHLTTKETLAVRGPLDLTLLHLLAETGVLHQIKDLITAEHLQAETLTGETVIHLAAMNGQIWHLRHLLRPEDLKLRDCNETTVAHLAAANGTALKAIKSLLTSEIVGSKNQRDQNVAHIAAENQLICLIAGKLTVDVVCATDNEGNTPIDLALECDLDAIEANQRKFSEEVWAQFAAQMIGRLSRPAA